MQYDMTDDLLHEGIYLLNLLREDKRRTIGVFSGLVYLLLIADNPLVDGVLEELNVIQESEELNSQELLALETYRENLERDLAEREIIDSSTDYDS